MNQQIADALAWRYATKAFDPSRKVSEADLATLLDAARLAPSSFGLQPWKILVIEDPALRATLRAAAWNQAQVTDASHLVVFCRRDTVTEADVARLIDATVAARQAQIGDSAEAKASLEAYRQMMLGFIAGKSPEALGAWNARQAYIALGFMLEAAALLKVDACPMEGFDGAKFDEILGLAGTGYSSAVICPVGYRSAADVFGTWAKVRYPAAEVIERR